jgi:hypothetical protein
LCRVEGTPGTASQLPPETMINAALNIAWSISEFDASTAGFAAILPTHFWIGCCKGCDLDFTKFLQNAPPEVRGMEADIARDFQVIREVLSSAKLKPSALRRGLRDVLGKIGKPTARPLHRHPDLRTAFASGRHLAEITGRGLKPVHVLFSFLQSPDPVFDDCMAALGADRKALVESRKGAVPNLDQPGGQKQAGHGSQQTHEERRLSVWRKPGKTLSPEQGGRDQRPCHHGIPCRSNFKSRRAPFGSEFFGSTAGRRSSRCRCPLRCRPWKPRTPVLSQ